MNPVLKAQKVPAKGMKGGASSRADKVAASVELFVPRNP